MRALVTGSRGTVGSVLCRQLLTQNIETTGWDRDQAPPGDRTAADLLFEHFKPTVVFHTALPSRPTGMDNEGWIVNEKWTADIAGLCAERGIAMVYVSTVMVFTNRTNGPFTPDVEPDEAEGYGHSKRRGEQAAHGANPAVRVARLGWQIGESAGSNNMIDFIEKQMAEKGEVTASKRWFPATSFLEDTAEALIDVAALAPGTYHLDSNTRWNFHEILTALNARHGHRWKVRATDDYAHDQRMTDARVKMPGLDRRLALA